MPAVFDTHPKEDSLDNKTQNCTDALLHLMAYPGEKKTGWLAGWLDGQRLASLVFG